MKYSFFYRCLIALVVFVIASCTHDLPYDARVTDEYLHFSFSTASQTRAEIDKESGVGNFETGDEIGLYAFLDGGPDSWEQTNYFTLTNRNGEWQPRLTRSAVGTGQRTLHACYPATKESLREDGVWHPFEVESDQSSEENWRKSDLLWGQEALPESNRITIGMAHKMFRVDVDFGDLEGMVSDVQVRGKRKGRMQLTDGEFFPNDEDEFEWIRAYELKEKVYSAMIVPLTTPYANYYQPEDLLVQFTLQKEDGETKVCTYKVAKTYLNNMYSGRRITIRLTEKGSETVVDTDFANKKMWVYGINSPVYPGKEHVKVYTTREGYDDYTPNEWYVTAPLQDRDGFIKWEKGCGWYDCNKYYHKNPDSGDGEMCWAAAASNMLHWWVALNADYIRKYDADYPQSSAYPRPSFEYKEEERSPIFQFFIYRSPNQPGYTSHALNWFLTAGSTIPLSGSQWENFPGFFPGVLGAGTKVTPDEQIMGLSRSKFNEVIKSALKNRQAIGFTPSGRRFGGTHAMTIWGAEFDENGEVSYIYYVDSNDGFEQEATKYSVCIRQKIVYYPLGGVGYDVPHMQSSSGKEYDSPVARLCLLGLERDKWAKKYGVLPLPGDDRAE